MIETTQKHFTVYKTTHLDSSKFYIGVHETFNIDDKYLGSGNLIERAVEKYGEDGFKKEILFVFDNSVDAFKKEAELVTKEQVVDPMCYNIKEGGSGNSSNDAKALWCDDEYRKDVLDKSLSKTWNDPKHKAKLRKATRTPEYRKKQSILLKEIANRPEVKAKTSENSKERWKDSDYRDNMRNKTKAFMSGSCFIYSDIEKCNKRIKKEELENYTKLGWKRGMNLKFKKQAKQK
jgi:hypothetical protein